MFLDYPCSQALWILFANRRSTPALGILFVLPYTYLFADGRPCLCMTSSVNKALRMDPHVSCLVRHVTKCLKTEHVFDHLFNRIEKI